jgi:ABC-type sugar transport system substrate-binding protein
VRSTPSRPLGKTPGQDVKLVSIDGNKDALTAVDAGELFASVECNPRFGPVAYDTLESYAGGEPLPIKIVSEDRLFDRATPPRTSSRPTEPVREWPRWTQFDPWTAPARRPLPESVSAPTVRCS